MIDISLEMSSYMGGNIANFAIEDEQTIDHIACKVLKNDCPPFLAPMSVVEINGKTTLRYDVGNRTSLSYFSAKLQKTELLKLWDGMVSPLVECTDWLLRYEAFCLNPQFVFIDRRTLKVQYIYLPVIGCGVTDDDMKSIFMGIMEQCELLDGQDLQIELYKFFAQKTFSLPALKEIIDRHSTMGSCGGHPVMQAPPTPYQPPQPTAPPRPTPPPPVMQPRSVAAATPQPAAVPDQSWRQKPNLMSAEESLEQELLNSMAGGKDKKPAKEKKEKKPLFSFAKKEKEIKPDKKNKKDGKNPSVVVALEQMGQPVVQREIIRGAAAQYQTPPPRVQQPTTDDGVTELFAADNGGGGAQLRLANGNTAAELPRAIDLDFSTGVLSIGRFDAGKGIRQSDVEFPTTVKSVSRFHARMEQQGGQYMIIDLGSANGTFVNGTRLAPNMPAVIHNGDCIGFSDKGIDYIFSV